MAGNLNEFFAATSPENALPSINFARQSKYWLPQRNAPVSSIFEYVTFCLMWFLFGAKTPAPQSWFQATWFVEGLLSQTLVVHVIRTAKIPSLPSRVSWALGLLTTLIIALGFPKRDSEPILVACPCTECIFSGWD